MTEPRTGLIVINLQRAFLPPPEMVEGIQAILDNYDVVVATQFLNRPHSMFESELKYARCQVGSPESEIVIPLKPKSVFDHFTYGLQPAHIERIKEYNVPVWHIAGCDTEAGVLKACFDLWDQGIRFRVLKELCHSSGGAGQHEAGLKVMRRSFGQ